jgi:hypothetical protein
LVPRAGIEPALLAETIAIEARFLTIDFVSRARWQKNSELRKPATKPGPTTRIRARGLGGVHAVLYPPAIAVLKRGEDGGGGVGIKDGIKQAGRKGKVLVRQRIIARFDPSRPSQLILQDESPLFVASFGNCGFRCLSMDWSESSSFSIDEKVA